MRDMNGPLTRKMAVRYDEIDVDDENSLLETMKNHCRGVKDEISLVARWKNHGRDT